MRFVIDANILFALSKPSSVANNILLRYKPRLLAPDFALFELYKYKRELIKKSGIDNFDKIIDSLKSKVVFVDKAEYKALLKKAHLLLPDPKDAPYLALALYKGLAVWSNDQHFKEQSLIKVFTTEELIKFLPK